MIVINGSTIPEYKNIFERNAEMRGAERRVIEIRIGADAGLTYDDVAAAFSDGAEIVHQVTRTRRERQLTNPIAEGEEIPEGYKPEYAMVEVPEVIEYDLSDFCVAGNIVDKRDGSFVVYMGKKTEAEELEEELAAAMLEGGNE